MVSMTQAVQADADMDGHRSAVGVSDTSPLILAPAA